MAVWCPLVVLFKNLVKGDYGGLWFLLLMYLSRPPEYLELC